MHRLLLPWMLFQTGCFRGLFSEAPRYLATEYVVDKPRIVALKAGPVEMVSGAPTTFEALLVAPPDANIQQWNVSVCGLNPDLDTQTYIWDLLCFEKETAVSELFTTTALPYTFAVPTFPEVDCNDDYDYPDQPQVEDTGRQEDTGWFDEGMNEYVCSHHLPIMVEAIVDDSPVYAAAFTSWYPKTPYHLQRSQAIADAGIGLIAPTTAAAGSEVPLEIKIATDAQYANFQWYIDAGTLLDTGITVARTYTTPTETQPYAQTTSNNRLVIPSDYRGELRVWVVIHEPWMDDLNMTWTQTTIEVTP